MQTKYYTTEERKAIAATIRTQISNKVLFMIGAKDIFFTKAGLVFGTGRNPKGVNKVEVILHDNDEYQVVFYWIGRRKGQFIANEKGNLKGIYAGQLKEVIQEGLGITAMIF